MLYLRQCSRLRRRRNLKLLVALLFFLYLGYSLVLSSAELNSQTGRVAESGGPGQLEPAKDPIREEQVDGPSLLLPRDPRSAFDQWWGNYDTIKDNGRLENGIGARRRPKVTALPLWEIIFRGINYF
jgi:hypothetical protein